jgi:hypothetical protein
MARQPVHLKTGDCFLLPHGRPFRLASDLSLPPVNALDLLRRRRLGGIGIINGGGSCMLVGGHFVFNGKHTGMLLEACRPSPTCTRSPTAKRCAGPAAVGDGAARAAARP